jgi:hypothetical protein
VACPLPSSKNTPAFCKNFTNWTPKSYIIKINITNVETRVSH